MAKKKRKPCTVTTVRLPTALLDTLDADAEAEGRSRNWLIERLLTLAVEARAPRPADGETAGVTS